MEVKGRNIITGLPKVATLTSEEIRTALRETTGQIVETVHGVLEKTPPELAADIMDRGIVLTGGVGFANSSYFCRSFREYYGSSPESYRKGNNEDEESSEEV